MAVMTDRWGEPLTAADAGRAANFDHLVEGYLTFSADILARLREAVGEGDVPLALCVEGFFQLLSQRPTGWERARVIHENLASRPGLTERERGHVAALHAWSSGSPLGAADCWDDVLDRHPRDFLALRLQHFLLFGQGQVLRMRDTLARAIPGFTADVPNASYVAGMVAFTAEEMGELQTAEALGLAAVDADPEDLWAVHAIAHVLETQGRLADGIGWLTERGALVGKGGFANHIWWHKALYLVELDRVYDVLELFDSYVYAGQSEEGLDLTNAVSLLLRLEMAGHDVGNRWARLAPQLGVRLGLHTHPFNDAHYAAGLCFGGRTEEAEALLTGMAAWAATQDDGAAAVLQSCGLVVARGIAAYAAGRFAEAVQHLVPVRYEWWRLGGSHAQRDLFAQVLVAAAQRSGQLGLAARLLAERTGRKNMSPAAWAWHAQVLAAQGDEPGAARAADRAQRLRSVV